MQIEPHAGGFYAIAEIAVPKGNRFETMPGKAIVRQFGWTEARAVEKCQADIARVTATLA